MTSSSSTQGSKIFPLRLIVSLIIMFHYGTKTRFFMFEPSKNIQTF